MARILVVDDDPMIQATLPLALLEHGHEVVQALNGVQALKELRRQPSDLVVTDVLMPEADGLELIRAVQKEFPRLPLVAMSGGSARLPGVDALQLAHLLGACVVLPKPFTESDLVEAIRKALRAG
jgi:CheY-like chemotaxis protein